MGQPLEGGFVWQLHGAGADLWEGGGEGRGVGRAEELGAVEAVDAPLGRCRVRPGRWPQEHGL